jgi:hypothetical protein
MLYSSWRFREKIGLSAAAPTLAAQPLASRSSAGVEIRPGHAQHRPRLLRSGPWSRGERRGGSPLILFRSAAPWGTARCTARRRQRHRSNRECRPRGEESHFRLPVTAVLGAPRNGSRWVRRFREAHARGHLSVEETHADRESLSGSGVTLFARRITEYPNALAGRPWLRGGAGAGATERRGLNRRDARERQARRYGLTAGPR